jgi:hypothetical protein
MIVSIGGTGLTLLLDEGTEVGEGLVREEIRLAPVDENTKLLLEVLSGSGDASMHLHNSRWICAWCVRRSLVPLPLRDQS